MTAAAAAVVAGVRWQGKDDEAVGGRLVPSASPVRVSFMEKDTMQRAAHFVADHDLFRVERRPSGVPYLVSLIGAPPPAATPRPVLVLTGVLGGPPWQGVVEGIPGTQGGVLVLPGSVVNGYKIKAVSESTAIVEGQDTSWTLTLKRGW
ncbi:MAG TPA: hypothetical protein VFK13_14830 [Gemmatimonadaceae bacterium]|nr:hypothetical protein [Gemmatimonadaceae bacterium]